MTLSLAFVPATFALSLSGCDFINNFIGEQDNKVYEIEEGKEYSSDTPEFKQELNKWKKITEEIILKDNFRMHIGFCEVDGKLNSDNVKEATLFFKDGIIQESGEKIISKNDYDYQKSSYFRYWVQEDGVLKVINKKDLYGDKFEKREASEEEKNIYNVYLKALSNVTERLNQDNYMFYYNEPSLYPNLTEKKGSVHFGSKDHNGAYLSALIDQNKNITQLEFYDKSIGINSGMIDSFEAVNIELPNDKIIDYTVEVDAEKFQKEYDEIMEKISEGNYTVNYNQPRFNKKDFWCLDYDKLMEFGSIGNSTQLFFLKNDKNEQINEKIVINRDKGNFNLETFRSDLEGKNFLEERLNIFKSLNFSTNEYDYVSGTFKANGSDGVEYEAKIVDGKLYISYPDSYYRQSFLYFAIGTSKIYLPGYADKLFNDGKYVEPENSNFPNGNVLADEETLTAFLQYLEKNNLSLTQTTSTQGADLPQQNEERKRMFGDKGKNKDN